MPGKVDEPHEFRVFFVGLEDISGHGAELLAQRLPLPRQTPEFGPHFRPSPREQGPGEFFFTDIVRVHGTLRDIRFDRNLPDRGRGYALLAEEAYRGPFDPLLGLGSVFQTSMPKKKERSGIMGLSRTGVKR